MKPFYLIFFLFVLCFTVNALIINKATTTLCYDDGQYGTFDCWALFNGTGIGGNFYGANNASGYNTYIGTLDKTYHGNLTKIIFWSDGTWNGVSFPNHLKIYLCLNNDCSLKWEGIDRVGGSSAQKEINITISNGLYSTFNKFKLIQSSAPAASYTVMHSFNMTVDTTLDYNDSFPIVNIPNLQSVYCYNSTFQHLVITPNITDAEGDTISWYHYFDQDPIQKIVIDDFSKTDYSMMANDWDFNATGCNYSTTDGYLKLYNGCNEIGIIKRLYNGTFNPPLQFYLETSMFTNTSNEYCILNWQNEKVTCLKLSTINPNNLVGGKLTDFYYWNGSGYSWFYQSSYNAQDFGLQFDINSTNDKFCIWGNSNDGCEYEYSTQLYGTTTNQSAKFYMAPTYNFIWENYEPSFVKIDNIELTPKGNIPWRTYTVGDTLTYNYAESGTKELTILATDNVHSPDYKTFGFPVTVYGDCALPQYNQSNNTLANVPTMDYINAINDGPSKFNTVFYLIIFGVFLFIVFQSQSLELSLIVTGICGLTASWIISKDLVQMISSGSLIAVGIAVLIAKVF